jgi:methylenetetrahydrofolate--tRNA-(uracil-5-)-methyltransferase
MTKPVHVVGGGLAGSEAAWQIASAGVPVVLHEMRPVRGTDAHQTDRLAELVCSNSFRADDWTGNAVGLLHAEMRRLGSLIMSAGDAHQVPAGGALAVDREGFAEAVTERLEAHPLVTIAREEVAGLPPADWDSVILATGPLTSPALSEAILALTGEDALSFFDAIAPIVHWRRVDMDVAWRQSRYDKEGPGGDAAAYINCPMDKAQYDAFIDALLAGAEVGVQGLGARPLLRRLPADRGDGRAGPRDPAPRADEAGGPDQRPQPQRRPGPSCSCARTMRWARCGTWWASRPS